MIVFEDVTKIFQGQPRPAVDHVSLHVEAGQLVVLLGPSGCGKTTLLKMVNRLVELDSGRISMDGKNINDLPVTELRRSIGYVIQQVGLFPHMTIERNIAVVPNLLGWDKDRTNQRIDDLLTLVGLPLVYRKRFPRQLSGGEQQRVGLARALAADPGILLMDEPFAAIDAITRNRLQDELLRIQQVLHKTILFVTHDVEEALCLAERILVMQAGKRIQYGSPVDIIEHPESPFVRSLLGASDALRRLSLVSVRSLLDSKIDRTPAETGETGKNNITVGIDDDLRSALARLLESGSDRVDVRDATGQMVGQLYFDDLRRVLRNE